MDGLIVSLSASAVCSIWAVILPHLRSANSAASWEKCRALNVYSVNYDFCDTLSLGGGLAQSWLFSEEFVLRLSNQLGEQYVSVLGGKSMSGNERVKLGALLLRSRFALLLLIAVLMNQSCTAFNPQGAAIQQAPNYYNEPYSQLSPQQKMQLEDHLANQSNQAWRTSADVASGAGQLEQGTGFLLRGIGQH